MKSSRSSVHCKAHKIPDLTFEEQTLTSFAGLVMFQAFFTCINLKARLNQCFGHLKSGKIFGHTTIFLQLLIHILLGYRDLRDSRFYRDDPLVQRLLGLKHLPDVATISRMLKDADEASVEKLRAVLRDMVLERMTTLALPRVTLDFDGSVQSTGRFAEGTAVGFNKKRKGSRSYYPLFATVAQTGQVLDFLHRPGNVHDSRGARAFVSACMTAVQRALPHAQIEIRMDSAFFSNEIIAALDRRGIEFTVSVPFERFAQLKGMIEGRKRWRRFSGDLSFFETSWKPKKWNQRFRFVFVRTRAKKQHKGPVQLDLFIPYQYGYEFKVVITNKTVQMKTVMAFHNGRGSQEGIFAELKSQAQMGYIPVRTQIGNQLYLVAGVLAHNLTREFQMMTTPRRRKTSAKRAALWVFEQLDTLRRTLIQRAGRLTRPHGKLTLTISANQSVRTQLLHCLAVLQ
jgi:hypothetical protein